MAIASLMLHKQPLSLVGKSELWCHGCPLMRHQWCSSVDSACATSQRIGMILGDQALDTRDTRVCSNSISYWCSIE